MSEIELDLRTIQDVVDLGPYRLVRCKACREVNLVGRSPCCCWCGANLRTGATNAAAAKKAVKIERCSRRGPSGPRPKDKKPHSRSAQKGSKRAR